MGIGYRVGGLMEGTGLRRLVVSSTIVKKMCRDVEEPRAESAPESGVSSWSATSSHYLRGAGSDRRAEALIAILVQARIADGRRLVSHIPPLTRCIPQGQSSATLLRFKLPVTVAVRARITST
jgi:hypothetical protein